MFENLFTNQSATKKKKSADIFAGLFDDKPITKQDGGMFDGLFDGREKKIEEEKQSQSVWRNVPTATDWTKTQPMSSKTKLEQAVSEAKKAKQKSDWLNSPLGIASETLAAQNLAKAGKQIFLEEPARRGAGLIIQGTGGEYQPQSKLEKFVLGDKPIKELSQQGKETLQSFGIPEKQAGALGLGTGLVFMGLDISGFGGSKTKAAEVLAKINKAEDAVVALKKMGVADDIAKQYAPIVAKTTKETDILKMVSAIEKAQNGTKKTAKGGLPELGKTDTTEYLYHGTSKDAFENIKKEGIKPQRRGVSSLSKSEDYSKNWAFPPTNTQGVMLRVRKDFLNGKTITTKKSRPETDKLYEVLTKETIPPEFLEVYKNGKWQPIIANKPAKGGLPELGKTDDLFQEARKKPAGAGVRVDQAIPEGTEGVRPKAIENFQQSKLYQGQQTVKVKEIKDISSKSVPNIEKGILQQKKEYPQYNQSIQKNRSYPKPYNEKTEKAIAQTAKTLKEPPNLVKRVIDSLKETQTKLIEYIQNTDERVRQLVERKDVKISDISDPYLKMTLYPGRVASKIETAKSEASAIIKDLQQSKISRKEISDYLIARHAPERNLALGSKAAGIGTLEAHTKLKAIEASPKGATIKVLADRVQKLNNQTLDLLKESGVISDELYTKLRIKYKNHIPLNRIMDNTDDIGAALSTRGYTVRSTGIKRAVGSELEVNDILGNVISNYEQAVIRSEKNIVDQATLAFARDNKDILGDLMEVVKPQAVGKSFDGKILMQKTNDPTILQLYENGKPIWIKIKDPQLAIALQGAGKEKLGGLLNAVAKITRIYSGLATRFNPEFALPNKIRDLQETMVYLSAQGKMGVKDVAKMNVRDSASVVDIVDYLKGGKSNGAKLYQEMKNLGGTTGGFGLSTRGRVELSLKEMETLANSKTKQLGKNLIQYIDNWNTIFEDSTRLSVYKTALDKGVSKERAAAMAKEASINFNRMGKGGPVINALYMFSNASIQGSAKMIRSLKNPKVLGTVVLTVGGSVAAISKFNDMADKDWRDKVSKWDRLNGLPVVVPSTDGNFRYFTIPVSWGIKPIKVMADYADDAMNGIATNATDAINKIMAAMLDAYNPMGGTDLTSALTPTVLDMPSEIKANKSWSGNPIRPTLYDKNTPADVQYFSSLKDTLIGRTAISITEKLQKNIGIAISPADIKYSFDQLVGGFGRTISKTINLVFGFISNKPLPPSEYPIFSRFYKERTEEEIGQGAGVETEKIKKILGEQSRERFQLKQQAENTFDAIKAEPDKAKKKQMLLDVAKENPDIVEKMMEIAKDKALGLNYSERMIKQLGVENGERAEYIASKIKEMKNKEEKREYVKNLIEKKILTDDVAKQLILLLKK